MCRLFGSVGKTTIADQEFENLTLMSKKGGPNSTNIYKNQNIQFGFNRLAILDTTANGDQPFFSDSGRYVLMINGEVYNYKELVKEFKLTDLKSKSDAEVVLKLIEKISFEKAIHELNGMFAISCWDNQDQKLYLARDFAGIKPLFYTNTTEGLVFGSQFNQLIKHPWSKTWKWSNTGLSEFLQFGYMMPPYTIAENIFQLGVGEYLIYSQRTKTILFKKYKRFFENSGNIPELHVDATQLVSAAVSTSVKRQMVSDVPLGVFLSGGIDSTLVASKARELNPNLTAVTIGFEEEKYDETAQAVKYAKYLNLKHHHVELFSNQGLMDIVNDHFHDMTEPIADYSSLPMYLISKIARKTNTVMLSGDGGDELFWGYPRFKTFANSAPFFRIPNRLTKQVSKKALKFLGFNITDFLGAENLGDANMSFHSYNYPDSICNLIGDYQLSNETKNGYSHKGYSKKASLDYLRNNEFYFHLQKILVKVDRMSMANSLEVRVPLLDKEVIEAAQQIYSNIFSSKVQLKHLLKQELQKHIPLSLIENKKKGFTPPLEIWLKNELKEDFEYHLLNSDVEKFSKKEIKIIWDKYNISGGNDLESIWTIYVLLKWISINC